MSIQASVAIDTGYCDAFNSVRKDDHHTQQNHHQQNFINYLSYPLVMLEDDSVPKGFLAFLPIHIMLKLVRESSLYAQITPRKIMQYHISLGHSHQIPSGCL